MKEKVHYKTREERELKFFHDLAEQHNHDWWGYETPAASTRMERRVELLKYYLDPKDGDKILECGCGSGYFTQFISDALEKKTQMYSVELSSAQIELARSKVKNPNVHFKLGSITQLEFEDNFFDFVIGNGILHHLDIELALKEIKRVLKPEGKILFFEPNLLNPHLWLAVNIEPFRKMHEVSPDEKPFYRWQLKKQLLALGLKNVTVKPFDFIYPLIPLSLIEIAKKIERIVEKTFLNEIAGCLIVYAEK